jgi:hypothetical protein
MTLHVHQTVETVTDENFNEGRYLAANPDLQDAKRHYPTFDARAHFRIYGRKEGRQQLARISHTRERWTFDLRRSTVYIHGWLDRITERQRAAALDHRDHVGGVVWRQGGCALSGSC